MNYCPKSRQSSFLVYLVMRGLTPIYLIFKSRKSKAINMRILLFKHHQSAFAYFLEALKTENFN